jgi:hypothetical protein
VAVRLKPLHNGLKLPYIRYPALFCRLTDRIGGENIWQQETQIYYAEKSTLAQAGAGL